LAFWLISCGSSTTDDNVTTGTGTAAVAENQVYVDFAPQASSDGQKLAYLYNESTEPKLSALSTGIAIEPTTDELGTSLSDDGNWILTWRSGSEKNYLVLNSFDQTQQTTLVLSRGARLRELTLAPSGQRYLAYTERLAEVDSVNVYAFTPGSPVVTGEKTVIIGEYGPQFAVSGSDVYLFTRKVATGGKVTIQYRKRSTSGSWDLQAGTVTVDAAVPSAASNLGLVFSKSLDVVRLKTKLGTFETATTEYQKSVGIVQEVTQFQGFSSSSVDFSAEDYRQNQPVTLGGLSATADGAYLLLNGYDAWFCKTRTQSSNVMLLVRVSDGATLPLLPTREAGAEPWTGIVSEPCSYFDQDPMPKLQDFDITAVNGQILSVTGSRVTLIFESKYTGDREIRRLSFDASDWTAKTYANVVFTDISANRR
jgi:hypothetical protein